MNAKITICFAAALLAFSGCAKINPESENDLQFFTKDGVILKGKFRKPADGDKFTFIMLHGLGSIKEEWLIFAGELEGKGYGYLIFDLRGHGRSTKNKKGEDISYRYFMGTGPDSEWSKMPDDLNEAVKYLARKKGIRKNKMAVIGASLGANIAFIYSAENKSLPFTILLSPGWDYAGLSTERAAASYGARPVLLCASPGDTYAHGSCLMLKDILAKNAAKPEFVEGSLNRHGVAMFDGKFDEKALSWIENNTRPSAK